MVHEKLSKEIPWVKLVNQIKMFEIILFIFVCVFVELCLHIKSCLVYLHTFQLNTKNKNSKKKHHTESNLKVDYLVKQEKHVRFYLNEDYKQKLKKKIIFTTS